ncbi:MAG: sulfatase-like hydrolase/transferase [Polyangiaceae bacterium]
MNRPATLPLLVVVLSLFVACDVAPRTLGSGAVPRFFGSAREADGDVALRTPKRAGHPVVLVTLDGARWQELFLGTDEKRTKPGEPHESPAALFPNVYRALAGSGCALGAPGHGVVAASGPNFVSLPGYTEIFTGRAPVACGDNDCARTTIPTILDQAHAMGLSVAAHGSWERLERAATKYPGTFPASFGRGTAAGDPYPGTGEFRPDRDTAAKALRVLEDDRPDLLYVGLGEPDEYAHRGDYAGYVGSLRRSDAFLGDLFAALGRMGERGAATHVIVTADHGRADDFVNHGGGSPESARVFLLAFGPEVSRRGFVHSRTPRKLGDVAPTLATLLGFGPDGPESKEAREGDVVAELFDRAEVYATSARRDVASLPRRERLNVSGR